MTTKSRKTNTPSAKTKTKSKSAAASTSRRERKPAQAALGHLFPPVWVRPEARQLLLPLL